MEIALPTLDEFKSLFEHRFSSFQYRRILYLSVQFSFSLFFFFRKRPLPFAGLDKTLDSHVNGSHETGTPWLIPGKTHPLDSRQSPVPHRGHKFGNGHADPSVGPCDPSSLSPFQHHEPSSHKTLFDMQVQGSGFALLDTPPWLPLS